MSENIIPIARIIDVSEKIDVSDIDSLLKHINNRQEYFIATLAALFSDRSFFSGWQRIMKNADNTTHKEMLEGPDKDGLFTGEYLCSIAAIVLGDAIRHIAMENELHLVIEIADIETDFFAEDGEARVLKKHHVSHTILKITDVNTKKSFYLDPTFAQIDHRFSGKILNIPEHSFNDFYKSVDTTPAVFMPFSSYDREVVKDTLSSESYQTLMSTLIQR